LVSRRSDGQSPVEDLIHLAREGGLSDKELVAKLQAAAEALREGLI
jgi:hypothetical protein